MRPRDTHPQAGTRQAGARGAGGPRAATPRRPTWISWHGGSQISEAEDRLLARLAWALAALLAAALLAMVLGPHRIGDYFTETDFYGSYAQGAKLVEHGRLIPSRYGVVGPGYEVALGLVGFAVRDLFLAGELLSVAATVATLLLWFHLLRRRAGARVAFLTGLFLAANAAFFRYGYGAVTDAFSIALQAAALYLLLARGSGRAMAAAGLVAALAFLTRYNAIYLLPAGVIAALGGGTFAPRRGRAALLFTLGFLLPVVPWVAYSLAHGAGFSFQLHHNIAYEVFARARGMAWDDYQKKLQPEFKTLWDVIARDPGAVVRRMLWNVGDHLRLDALQLLGWPTALAAAAGLFLGLRDGTLARLWPVGIAGALLFGTLVPVFYSVRYSLALLPAYAALAATAFASPLGALVVGRRPRVWLKPLLAALPLASALHASWREQVHVIDQLPVEVLDCARTLRALKAPGDRVIARKWHIAYHAGVEPLAFPFTSTIAELADYARQNRARWLYFSWPEAETRPDYWFLLDTTATVPGLTPRRVTRPHPAVLYEIGRDFGAEPAWFSNDTLFAYHTVYARLLVDGPRDPKLLYRFGGIAWSMGRMKQARGALEVASRLDPNDTQVLLLLGDVLLSLGEGARAAEAYGRAESLAPGNVAARVGRGWARLLEGRPRDAAAAWRPVISLTRNPRALERMAALFAELGDREAEAEARSTLARLRGNR